MKLFLFPLLTLFASPLLAKSSIPIETGTTDEIVSSIDAVVAKKNRDKATVAALIQALGAETSEVRTKERAAWALGQLRAETASKSLLTAVTHKSLLIRSAALNSLIQLRVKAALPNFIEIAKKDPVLSLRQRATLALGLLGSDKAIEPVVQLSSDEREEIRGAAALAMAGLDSSRNDFSEALKDMQKDPSPYVQDRAKKALSLIRGPAGSPRTLLTSEDSDLRLFAALRLKSNGKSSDLKAVTAARDGEAVDDVREQLEAAVKAIKARAAKANSPKPKPPKNPPAK